AAALAPSTNDNRWLARPSATNSSSPASRMGTSPRDSISTFSGTTSAHTTSWPRWAKQAPVVSPTYPVPITAIRLMSTSQSVHVPAAREVDDPGPVAEVALHHREAELILAAVED